MDPSCRWLIELFWGRYKAILAHLEGDVVEYAMQFNFSIINNETEYEVLLTGLKIIKELGVGHLIVYSDSQLVVG